MTSVAQAEAAEEVEIHEYRLMRRQMDQPAAAYPDRATIQGLDFPMIGGNPVLTCDNSVFQSTHADIDRTGLVFSVPYYDGRGKFAGVVSAVVRVGVLASFLPDARYALVSTADQVVLTHPDAPPDLAGNPFLAEAKPDPTLLYSGTAEVATADPLANWTLWAAWPDSHFEEGPKPGPSAPRPSSAPRSRPSSPLRARPSGACCAAA